MPDESLAFTGNPAGVLPSAPGTTHAVALVADGAVGAGGGTVGEVAVGEIAVGEIADAEVADAEVAAATSDGGCTRGGSGGHCAGSAGAGGAVCSRHHDHAAATTAANSVSSTARRTAVARGSIRLDTSGRAPAPGGTGHGRDEPRRCRRRRPETSSGRLSGCGARRPRAPPAATPS